MIVVGTTDEIAKGFAVFVSQLTEQDVIELPLLDGRSTNQDIGKNEVFIIDKSKTYYTSKISPAALFRSKNKLKFDNSVICLSSSQKFLLSNYVLTKFSMINPVVDHFLFIESQIETLKNLIIKHKMHDQKVWGAAVFNVKLDNLAEQAPRWIDRLLNFIGLTVTTTKEKELFVNLLTLAKTAPFESKPEFFDQNSTKIIKHFTNKL